MKKLTALLAILFFMLPSVSFAAALTQQQSSSLIAVVQSSPGTPASAFVSLITAFSNITVNQASSLIAVVQAAPGVPASAFVNLLTSFTVDTPTSQSQPTAQATSQAVTPIATTTSGTIPATPAIPSTPGTPTIPAIPAVPATPAAPAQQKDTTAPIISNIQVTNITENSAIITWTTNELSDSKVYFSPVTATSTPIGSTSALVTSHSANLSSLAYLRTYNFVVVSKDASGNTATSSEKSFSTTARVVRPDPTGVRQFERTTDKIYWVLGFSSGHYTIENVEVRETPFCVFTAQVDRCRIEDIWNQQPKLSYPVYVVTEGGDIPGSPIYFNQKILITVSNLVGDKGYAFVYDIVDTATGYRWKSDYWGVDQPR